MKRVVSQMKLTDLLYGRGHLYLNLQFLLEMTIQLLNRHVG